MESLHLLLDGFALALTPVNLLYALVGVTLGTLVGVLPGVGPAMTVALLLPITFTVPPASSFIMFAGIYYSGMYGGSTTSILLNTPGESSSMITALLVFAAPAVVSFAISFGPEDYVALAILAFTAVSSVLSRSVVRGLASLGLGLMIGLVGIDQQTGQARLTLGIAQLLDGIDVVIVAVGLFAARGVYALNASAVDLVVLYLLGLLGFAMRRFGLPVAPAVIGMVLGPMAEIQLRRALAIGAGDVDVLVGSPIAVVLLVLSALALLTPLFRTFLARRTGEPPLPVSRED